MSWGDAAGHGVGAGGELTLAEETFLQGLAGIAFQTGDIIYYNGTALTRLGIGSANQVLTVSGGLPNWAASSGGGVSDHGALTGLADDDHTQYALNTHSFVTVSAEARFTAERVLTGTANQITITDGGAGSTVTLSTPQDIAAASSPTFAGLTVSGLTASRIVSTTAGSALASVADLSTWVAGTANRVTVANDGDGTITLSGPQDIHTAASPTFVALNLTAATNQIVLDSDAVSTGTLTMAALGASRTWTLPNDTGTLSLVRTFTAGSGLTGGGDFTADRTFTVGAGNGITVNADDVAVNQAYAFAWTAAHTHTVAGLVYTMTNTTDAASMQVAILESDSATPAANDEAYLSLRLSDSAGNQDEFGRLTWVGTDATSTSEDGRIDFAVVTAGTLADELQLDGTALAPSTTDGLALGTSSLNWADIFLDLGAVINFDSGDVTLTHAANRLTIAGGEFDVGGATDNILVAGADPKRTLTVMAGGMWPATTNGAATLAKVNAATNAVDYQVLDFDQTTQEFAQFAVIMPDGWDAGTVTFKVIWTAAAGTGAVVWEVQGRSYANDDAIDQAWGTAVEVTDTLIATGDIHETSESAAVTLAGIPAAGEYAHFRIARDPANVSDTLTGDARLIGVRIEWTRGQFND